MHHCSDEHPCNSHPLGIPQTNTTLANSAHLWRARRAELRHASPGKVPYPTLTPSKDARLGHQVLLGPVGAELSRQLLQVQRGRLADREHLRFHGHSQDVMQQGNG